jgi:hypothetical protein
MRRLIVAILAAYFLGGVLLTDFLYGKGTKKEYVVALKLEKEEREPDLEQNIPVKDSKLFDSGPFDSDYIKHEYTFFFRAYLLDK